MNEENSALDLADFKNIEAEAKQQLTNGRIIIMNATLMLENAEKMIGELGGETEKKRVKRLAKEAEELKKKTT